MKRYIIKQPLLVSASSLGLICLSMQAIAQDVTQGSDDKPTLMNTIIVTTQKTEESLQDVPIAVSAFDPNALERLNIDTGQDLQFNIPNFQSSQGNFASGSIGIRGITNAAVAASSDSAVGVHTNFAPTDESSLMETEFFDVERIEILRGPQGTLYGRNATAGVINAITSKPNYDAFSAKLEATIGDYNTQKLTGYVNLPISENSGLRVAGYYHQRDGYSEAILPDGSRHDTDGRDLWATRLTWASDFTEKFSGWVMYEHFEEDSSRTRSTKQLCSKDTRLFPFNQGCVPYQIEGLGYARDANGNPIQQYPDFGTVNQGGTLGGVLGANVGVFSQFGIDSNAGATTSSDLREYETNILPEFEASLDLIQAEFKYEFDNNMTLTGLFSSSDYSRRFSDDYNKGIGTVKFNVTPLTPDLDGDGDGDWSGFGAFGLSSPVDSRMPTPADTLLATDISSSDQERVSGELRLQSNFDGPWNFNAGLLSMSLENETNYFVFFNTAEMVGVATGLPTDRTYFRSRSPYKLNAFGAFTEIYYDMNENFKWTAGLRYTHDDKEQLTTPSLLLAPSTIGTGQLNGEFEGGPVQEAEFKEVTGRFGFDWQLDNLGPLEDTLLYSFISRGYKGGGINPPQSEGLSGVSNKFDPEFINAIELGTKSTVMDGAGALNLSAFYYDYEGYQISTIVNRTSVNINVDAEVYGLEGEFYAFLSDNLRVDMTFGYLDTALADQDPFLDTYDQTGGNPDWLIVKNPATTQSCAARRADVEALLATPFAAAAALICTPDNLNATIVDLVQQSGADAATAQATANALTPEVVEGIKVDVSGNQIPRSPEYTFSFGAQYTFDLGNWDATLRGDYYHQAEMFTRIFNLEADRIDAWSNLNASLTFKNDNGLSLQIYGRNLLEDDQITNQYLTDASSGAFTNVFLLDPRQFGIKVAKQW